MQNISIVVTAFTILVSSNAAAFDKRTDMRVDARINKLLRLMDADKNGTVSKNEFMRYMSERFDELDADHSRRLEPDEVRAMNIPNWVIRKIDPNRSLTKPKTGTR